MGKKKTFYAGKIYVESGMCYIGDPSSVLDHRKYQDDNVGESATDEFYGLVDDAERSHPEPLDGAPQVLALEPLGEGQGLVFPSGMGDGIYPVYITLDNDGRPEAAMIVFKS